MQDAFEFRHVAEHRRAVTTVTTPRNTKFEHETCLRVFIPHEALTAQRNEGAINDRVARRTKNRRKWTGQPCLCNENNPFLQFITGGRIHGRLQKRYLSLFLIQLSVDDLNRLHPSPSSARIDWSHQFIRRKFRMIGRTT